MFRTAELGRQVSKTVYAKQFPALRLRLIGAQQRLRWANFPVIVVFAGVDGAGKGETVNLLNEWMDPRWIETRAYEHPSDEERERPEYWRYWRDMPRYGLIGLFLRSWYSQPVLDHVCGRIGDAAFDDRLTNIVAFENMLADDGALVIKFWMHLGKEAQHDRLKRLESDPLTAWRVTPDDWEHWRMYDRFVASAERTIMRTNTARAHWHIVEGWDERYRSLTVGMIIAETIEKRLDQMDAAARLEAQVKRDPDPQEPGRASRRKKEKTRGKDKPDAIAVPDLVVSGRLGVADLTPGVTVLSSLDMSQVYLGKDFDKDLEARQGRLNRLARETRSQGISSILVFEGWDASGKGGAIRRLTAALDARTYTVIPMAAPTDEEKVHHYLWRFWRHLQRAGRVLIFDRSWYGRVLVERVEGFASDAEWQRAYAEINDFEKQLVNHGIVLVKFWLHVTKEEQLRRFKDRQKIPYKRWKLTEEDWRNREKWELYELAVNDAVARTSTQVAPWTLVEGNDKRFARLKVIDTFCDKLEQAIAKSDAGHTPTLVREPVARIG
jgi:polyphosphate kinase 2 (PPK2 family)